MNDWFNFEKMITPAIIKGLFIILAALALLEGCGMILVGLATLNRGGLLMILLGLAWLVIGPILSRIYCELLIVVFLIHDNLVEIRKSATGVQSNLMR